jgi:hypothetical protein
MEQHLQIVRHKQEIIYS